MKSIRTRITQPPDYSALGREFASLRTALGYDQRHVANETGMSPSQVSRIERRKDLKSISFDHVVSLCKFYKLSVTHAAQVLGIWPISENAGVESDPRLQGILNFVAQMPPDKAEMFLEIIYRSAAALARPNS